MSSTPSLPQTPGAPLGVALSSLLREYAPAHGVHLVLGIASRPAGLGVEGRELTFADVAGLDAAALEAAGREALAGRSLGSVTLLDALPSDSGAGPILAALRRLIDERPVPLVVVAKNLASLERALDLVVGEPGAEAPFGQSEEGLRTAARSAGWREVGAADLRRSENGAYSGSVAHGPQAMLHKYLAAIRGVARPQAETAHLVRVFVPAPPPPASALVEEKRPFLTVVMRTQGQRPGLLRDALLALLGQTSTDFEVLVVAHNATGAQARTVQAIIDELPEQLRARTRLVIVEGGGRSRPLNVGFSTAAGRYIAILDDDDMVFAHWVETFESAARTGPGTILRAVAVEQEIVELEWPNGVTGYRVVAKTKKKYPSHFDLYAHLTENLTPPMVYAFPRGVFHELGLRFDEELNTLEDWDFELRCIMACGVTAVPEITAVYRRWRSGSCSYTLHSEEEWRANENRVIARLDRQPHLFPPGTIDLIRRQQAWIRKLEKDVGLVRQPGAADSLPPALATPPRPLRYDLADRLNTAIKRLPLVHPLIRASLGGKKQNGLDRE
jgi:hypothetical protein